MGDIVAAREETVLPSGGVCEEAGAVCTEEEEEEEERSSSKDDQRHARHRCRAALTKIRFRARESLRSFKYFNFTENGSENDGYACRPRLVFRVE